MRPCWLILLLFLWMGQSAPYSQIDSNLIRHVNILCDTLYEGRESGTWGQKMAAIYIQEQANQPVIQTFELAHIIEQSLVVQNQDTLHFARDFFYAGSVDNQICSSELDTVISCQAEQLFVLTNDFSNQNVAFLVEDWSNFLELFAHDFQTESKEIVGTKPQKSNAKFYINKSRLLGEDDSFCFEKRQRKEVISTENILVPFIRNTKNCETILISAHYDHLGIDSLVYYPGADDNASGVAILLEILREYQRSASFDTTKNVVFAFFSGEEQGLFGSEYFVNSDLFLKYSIDLCINLDMVGFVAKDFLYAIHYHQVQELLLRDFPESPDELQIEHLSQEHFLFEFSSDQRSFFEKGVPALMLFTGLHPDYHTPNDTPEQLDYEKMTYLKSWLIDFLK